MEKKIEQILAAVVVAVVIVAGVSLFIVFQGQQDDTSKFIGTWAIEEPEGEVYNATWTFYENNTIEVAFDYQGIPLSFWGTYQIENGQLNVTSPVTTPPTATYGYEFSNGNNRLTLSNNETTMVMNKVTTEDLPNYKYSYYSEIVIQNSWNESGYLEIIWKDMSDFQFSEYGGILSFGTTHLGHKTSKRTSSEFHFKLNISIYTNQSKKDKIRSHESDWTLTSNNNKAAYTIFIDENANISVDEQLIP